MKLRGAFLIFTCNKEQQAESALMQGISGENFGKPPFVLAPCLYPQGKENAEGC